MVMWVRSGHVDPLSRGIARRSSPQDGGGGGGGGGVHEHCFLYSDLTEMF